MFEREKRCLGYTVLSTLYMSAFIGEMLVPAFLKVEKTNMTCFFFFYPEYCAWKMPEMSGWAARFWGKTCYITN